MGEPRSWGEFTEELAKLIGQEADTGGSQTAGTVMAKGNAILSKLNTQGGILVRAVKSVQRLYTIWTPSTENNYSCTLKISAVDTSKAIVLIHGSGSSSNGAQPALRTLTSTAVTIVSGTGASTRVSIQVIEFY